MSFIWPVMLWTLLLVPALLAGYLWMQRRRRRYALRYASLSMVKEAVGRGPGYKRHIPPALFLTGFALLAVAAARPTAELRLPSQQATVVLAMDVSRSMLAEDVPPNRLEAAKAAALAFVDNQPDHVRLAIVAFASGAQVVLPPTDDKEAVRQAIRQLTAQNGTAIGRGILTSLAAIFANPNAVPTPRPFDQGGFGDPRSGQQQQQPAPQEIVLPPAEPLAIGAYASAVVVLLSDGQSNSGPRPLDIIDQAAVRGVRVYTVGLGSPDGAVVRFQGRAARVVLDEPTLKAAAQATGAQYFRATNETDLREIYQDLGRKLVFKTERTEITSGFSGAAAVLLLAAGGLSLLWFNRLP